MLNWLLNTDPTLLVSGKLVLAWPWAAYWCAVALIAIAVTLLETWAQRKPLRA